MGTRGLFGFRLGEKDYITYNHWDSYPDCLGNTVLEFLAPIVGSETLLATLRDDVGKLVKVERGVAPTPEQIEQLLPYFDGSVSHQSTADFYCLLRKTQGEPRLMLDARYYIDGVDFAFNSLSCEYAYIANLDTNELEFYKGFQPAGNEGSGRYRPIVREPTGNSIADQYGAIALKHTIPFKDITPDTVDDLVGMLNKIDAIDETSTA